MPSYNGFTRSNEFDCILESLEIVILGCVLLLLNRGLLDISFSIISICLPLLVRLDFLININPQITSSAPSVINANTEDQDEQPFRKLNLFGGHVLLEFEIFDDPRAILLYDYLLLFII